MCDISLLRASPVFSRPPQCTPNLAVPVTSVCGGEQRRYPPIRASRLPRMSPPFPDRLRAVRRHKRGYRTLEPTATQSVSSSPVRTKKYRDIFGHFMYISHKRARRRPPARPAAAPFGHTPPVAERSRSRPISRPHGHFDSRPHSCQSRPPEHCASLTRSCAARTAPPLDGSITMTVRGRSASFLSRDDHFGARARRGEPRLHAPTVTAARLGVLLPCGASTACRGFPAVILHQERRHRTQARTRRLRRSTTRRRGARRGSAASCAACPGL